MIAFHFCLQIKSIFNLKRKTSQLWQEWRYLNKDGITTTRDIVILDIFSHPVRILLSTSPGGPDPPHPLRSSPCSALQRSAPKNYKFPTFDTSGTRARDGFGISINVIFSAWGSEGAQGMYPPLGVRLNCLAFWHWRTGIMRASFTTAVMSEPEYLRIKEKGLPFRVLG